MKKSLALILTFIMVLGLLPSVALAVELNIKKVEIVDTIKKDGRLSLKVTGGADDDITSQLPGSGYMITWKRDGSEVKRVKVTGNEYNMADNGAWVNVAYDQGAQKTYTVTVSKDETEIKSASMKVDWNDKLQNRSFEEPAVAAVSDGSHVTVWPARDGTPAIQFIKQEKVPGWKTTVETDCILNEPSTGEPSNYGNAHWIEIGNVVKQYNNQNPYKCDKAKHGDQVAELNAIAHGALYQDVLTVPTATMKWQVSHRGRLGDDTMALVIAPLSEVEGLTEQTALRAYIDGKLNGAAGYNGDGVFIKTFKGDNTEWGTYTGSYIVPAGQFATRYFFVAMETHEGDLSHGNLLDDLDFETTTPLPDDDEGRLIIEKKIVGLSMEDANTLIAKEFITYQVGDAAVQPAKLNNLTADQNGFTATFTTDITIPANGEVTVTVAEDEQKAAVDDHNLTVSGTTQTVTIKERETQVVSFTNTYESTQPPLDTGTLTVKKTVTGLPTEILPASFVFEIRKVGNVEEVVESVTVEREENGNTYKPKTVKLPHGEYSVAEKEVDIQGYSLRITSDIPSRIVNVSADPATITFYNTYTQLPPNTGTITVKKTVSGGGADYNKAFTFTVKLEESGDTHNGEVKYGGVTFINGVTTFTLKHNQEKKITEIPAGMTYTVTESDNAGYTVTMSGNTGTIKAGETSTAAFNNYKAGGGGHGHYHPTTTPVPVMVIPPKTGDMTLLQYIARLLGLVR